jgi:hypothetical protein
MVTFSQISTWMREKQATVTAQPVLEDYESIVATVTWEVNGKPLKATAESWDFALAVDLAVEAAMKTK